MLENNGPGKMLNFHLQKKKKPLQYTMKYHFKMLYKLMKNMAKILAGRKWPLESTWFARGHRSMSRKKKV